MNDWAIILGASSGIGAACAKALAQQGLNIYGLYLRKKQTEIDKLTSELLDYKVKVIFKKGNVSNEDTINHVVDELQKQDAAAVKMLIHSVAFGTLKPMIHKEKICLNKKNIDMTLDVMSNNLLYWTQSIFTHNLFRKGSQIVAMTSAGGRKNWSNYGAVSLAKSGLESICRQLSLELAPYEISVNALQAGVTDTAALKKIPGSDSMIKKAIKHNPHGRLTQPEDIGDVVAMLANYESSWMTGNIIRLDGGEDITG